MNDKLENPLISVVIPALNEAVHIESCLQSILAQDYPIEHMEILVLDGGSTDGTQGIVERFVQEHANVRLLDNPRRIQAAAFNLGVRNSQGEVIFRMDAHTEYPSDYISNCLEVLHRTGAAVVGGCWDMYPGADTPTARAAAAAQCCRFGVGGAAFRFADEEADVEVVPFGCFRRDVLNEVGLMDERLDRNEDVDLYNRIHSRGHRIVLSPKIRMRYFCRPNFRMLARQAFSNGRWNIYSTYLGGKGLSLRHFIPLLFVVSVVTLAGLGFVSGWFWIALAGELALYSALAAMYAVKTSPVMNASALLTFLAFPLLHVSYGAASIWGILTAPLRFGLHPRRAAQDESRQV